MYARAIFAAIGWSALGVAALVHRFVLWFNEQSRPVQVGVVAAALAAIIYVQTPRVPDGPERLDEVEALARVIRSEAGTEPSTYRLHIAWATRNLAAERGQTILRMACSPCGRQGSRRPVSTRFRATDADRALAAHALGLPMSLDPTGGASHFINPRLQDQLARSGAVAGYRGRTYAVVRRRWMQRYNWEPYYRLGPTLEMWGPRRRVSRSSAPTAAH